MAGGCKGGRSVVPSTPSASSASAAGAFWTEPFDTLNPTRWTEVQVHRQMQSQPQFTAQVLEGRPCLEARSRRSASILMTALQFHPRTAPWLSWDWRVDQLVEGEALTRKEGSDAAARLYVYFDTKGSSWQKRSLDYVWSSSLPVGTVLDSAFSSNSKILVVESGTAALGRWRHVQRNLDDDYRRCFKAPAPGVINIGLMSDTDNTGGSALAYFDELRVSRSAAR